MGLRKIIKDIRQKYVRSRYTIPNDNTVLGRHNSMLQLGAKPSPYIVVDRDGDVCEVFTARNKRDAVKLMQERCREKAYPPYKLLKLDVIAELKPTREMALTVRDGALDDRTSGNRPGDGGSDEDTST